VVRRLTGAHPPSQSLDRGNSRRRLAGSGGRAVVNILSVSETTCDTQSGLRVADAGVSTCGGGICARVIGPSYLYRD
jgi:hypothetical protein